MAGMDEVGRLFNNNELIVAEVLQSAESMKAAVAHLEPFMEKTDEALKGTVMLATVKGDVHDIGKNLVEIILGNNGYRVVNLGIKVAPETLIAAHREHRPDIIGLSGLLVKSAQQMVVTAQDLHNAGVRCPILVGGAALTARFTANKIAPEYEELVCYANDAMNGLDLANQLLDPDKRPHLVRKIAAERERLARPTAAPTRVASNGQRAPQTSSVTHAQPIPSPPDLRLHVIEDHDLEEIFAYINPTMLYGKHLGLKGNLDTLLEQQDDKAVALHTQVRALQDRVVAKNLMRAKAVYKFFPAQSEGNTLLVYNAAGSQVVETFAFPRQLHGQGLVSERFCGPTGRRSDGLYCAFCGDLRRRHPCAVGGLQTGRAVFCLTRRASPGD